MTTRIGILATVGTAVPPAPALATALAAALALVLASCGQEDPTFRPGGGVVVEKGAIAVTSSVPGAAITLDSTATGRVTPDTLRELGVGMHRVGIFLGGYYPQETEVEVAADSVRAVHFELEAIPVTGAIGVEAGYPAAILIDGSATGLAAPDTVTGLAPGAHVVGLRLAGFRSAPAETTLVVVAGEMGVARFALLAPKVVVCEDFSNYACIPCVPATAALELAVAEFEPWQAAVVNPHVFWPGAADPFYQLNRPPNDARILYHQVRATPLILVDGVAVTEPTSAEAIRSAIEARRTVEAPLAIGVEVVLGATDYRIKVDVWGIAAGIPSDLLLFTCAVEREAILDPPGPNGQSRYPGVLRALFAAPAPGGVGGEPLGEIRPGERRTFEYTYLLQAGVDPAQLAAVAFAEEPGGGRRVFQTGTSFGP